MGKGDKSPLIFEPFEGFQNWEIKVFPALTILMMSATTALAVGIFPAPWPTNKTSPTASPLTNMALYTPSTEASLLEFETNAGQTMIDIFPFSKRLAFPISFITHPIDLAKSTSANSIHSIPDWQTSCGYIWVP